MTFYIYRHWAAEKKAVIHRAECGCCNNGEGCHKNPLGDKNGEWSSAFETFEDAKDNASKVYQGRKLEVRICKKCKPHLERN